MFSTRECRRDVLGALATAYFQNATHSTAWPRLVEMSGIPGLAPLFAQPVILPRHIHNYPFQRVQCVLRTLRRADILYNPYSCGMVGSTYAHRGPPLRVLPQHARYRQRCGYGITQHPVSRTHINFTAVVRSPAHRVAARTPRTATDLPWSHPVPAVMACREKRMHLHAQLATCLRLLRPQRSSAETGHACLL